MTGPVLDGSGRFFDALEHGWESMATQRRVASALVVISVVGLVLVEIRRYGWAPPAIAAPGSSTPVWG